MIYLIHAEDRAKQTQEEYNELLAILEKMKEKKKLLDRALEVIEARAQKLQETKDTKVSLKFKSLHPSRIILPLPDSRKSYDYIPADALSSA